MYSLVYLIVVQFILQFIVACDNPNDSITEPPTVIPTPRVFYVSTSGDDKNAGSIEAPWASWQKAFLMAGPGDTVYIRGGVYKAKSLTNYGVSISAKKGLKAFPICIFNYPNERPILDCSSISRTDKNKGIFLNDCRYYHLKGLTVTGVSQHSRNEEVFGFGFRRGGGHILEQCVAHDIQGPGFWGNNLDTVYVINCDAYNNFDRYTDGYSGGQADGFVFCFASGNAFTHLTGCRSWFNSDDGFDCWENDGTVIFDNCWAFNNGRGQGDGTGFKLGRTILSPLPRTQRYVRNCMAFNNRYIGFLQNGANVSMEIYNNIAFSNDMPGFSIDQFDNVIIARNNISYWNKRPDYYINKNNDHNTWNAGFNVDVDDGDFISVDSTGVSVTRNTNGALPILNFLRLAEGSDLKNAGVDVGLPYSGTAPDLGPYYPKK